MKTRIALVAWLTVVASGFASADPGILLHHAFDQSVQRPDYGGDNVRITTTGDVPLRSPAVRGKAAWFPQSDADARLRIEFHEPLPADGWTIALWNILHVKEWLAAPEDNLLKLLDEEGRPILKLSKSGGLFVYEGDREIHLNCFDALYWVRGSREHLTLTWEADGSGVSNPKGMLRAFWKARPYASLAVDLKRRPVALEIGQPMAGIGVDELYVFDEPLKLRSIWELMRQRGLEVSVLERQLTKREQIEAQRPTARRQTEWSQLVRKGRLVEAEQNPAGNVVSIQKLKPGPTGQIDARRNNAATASGRACVEPGDQTLTFRWNVDQAGDYALSLRYCLDRRMLALWPQNSEARTSWTENFCEIDVQIDGRAIDGRQRLYPTGVYGGHHGDVEMWAWQPLNGGRAVSLSKGKHTLSVSFVKGVARPFYDALLISGEPGPSPAHPRWVDQYRIPPAWWVAGHETSVANAERRDVYTVSLRNRCDEPCSYELIAGSEKLQRQAVSVEPAHIDLKPFEEKTIEVTFRSPASLSNNSEWANIYLWNDDVALRQKYRLWNLIPPKSHAAVRRPVLAPAPDPAMQKAYREWLKHRDPKEWTPELQQWVRSRNRQLADGSPVRILPRTMDNGRLAAVDTWMKMSVAEIEQYLPDGPAEFNGYGSGWERMGVEYSGLWHKGPKVTHLSPPGDIDNVTSLSVEGPPQEGKTEPYSKTYTATKDLDLISAARDTRWVSMMGHGMMGAAPYGDTPLGRTSHTGITLLAEAYYLTGDPAYAHKAFEMIQTFARKYTGLTKHFHFTLNREDRDWWGGRIGGRYLSKFGPRYYHAMGVYVLDLIHDALTPEQRTVIEHNVIRWGMYEGMSGPLFEVPGYFAAVNREDMPYLPMGRLLGDPAPAEGLHFFHDIYKDIVLDDGIHQCSIGSYGGVSAYVTFMQKLQKHGLDLSENAALRNCFSAHPSFIFSGGGLPNIDDGGGVNINGLGAGFGSPNPAQYAWGKELYGGVEFDRWPKLIQAAQKVNNAKQDTKADVIRETYADPNLHLNELWPEVYIAPVKGMAMLRNRVAAEPIDWKEVIFDYGRMGGRAHAHAAKLATIPSFNGQIVSMEYGYGSHGKPVSNGFQMRSYAHNVVVADGREQIHAIAAVPVGKLRESYSSPDVQWVDAESDRIYPGIHMRRTVFTTEFGIVDLHLCTSDKPHQYDWMYHSFGRAGSDIDLESVDRLAESGPLTFAVDPRTTTTNDTIQVTWENSPRTNPPRKESTALLHEKAFVRVWSLPSADTQVALFGIPIVESCGSEIDYLMLRRQATSTVFATVQEPWRESTGPVIRNVSRRPVISNGEQLPDHLAVALAVELSGKRHAVYLVNYSGEPVQIDGVSTDANVAAWQIDSDGIIQDPHHAKDSKFSVSRTD